MKAKKVWHNIIVYSKKQMLYPSLIVTFLILLYVLYKLLYELYSVPNMVAGISLFFAFFYFCVIIYKNIITIDIRLRSVISEKSSTENSLYDELEALLNNFEVLYKNRYQQQLLQNQAQIQALQNQINPHFLYNTLDSIRGQALEEKSKEIADMLGTLSAFFRYTISSRQDEVSIEQELRNVENYMKIQRYRFANRFSLFIDTAHVSDYVMRYKIPKLTLQPIVENAINHAFNNIQQGGKVAISLKTDVNLLIISVCDNGCGISEDKLLELNSGLANQNKIDDWMNATPYSGIALQNVNARLRLMYGARYGLHIFSSVGVGTTIEIFLPLGENIE